MTVVMPVRAPVEQALFNPDGRRIYFSTYAGVEGYDIETGKWLFGGAYGPVLEDGNHLVGANFARLLLD